MVKKQPKTVGTYPHCPHCNNNKYINKTEVNMTAKQFLEYFNLIGTDIEVIEIIQNFNVELFFSPHSLRHGKMNTYLEKCLVNSFSIKNNILQVYIK